MTRLPPIAALALLACIAARAADQSPPTPQAAAIAASEGAALYAQRCAGCHDNPRDRVPSRAHLMLAPPEMVIEKLTTGTMQVNAAGLTKEQIQALVKSLRSSASAGPQPDPGANMCATLAPAGRMGSEWNGWGGDAQNSRYQANPGIAAEDVPRLKVKWVFAIPGFRAGGTPSVAGNRLFLGIGGGRVAVLDAKTGCTYWIRSVGGVRGAISLGRLPAGKLAIFFGDDKAVAHALDADTGEELWATKVDEHPRARISGSVTLSRDRLYVPVSSMEEALARTPYQCCTFRGSVVALDMATGKTIWKSYVIPEEPKPFKVNSAGVQMFGPAGSAIWSAPTVDTKRKLIYATTGDSYTDAKNGSSDSIVAIDMASGRLKWVNQVWPGDNYLVGCYANPPDPNCPSPVGPDLDFGASAVLQTLPDGRQILLAGQKSGVLYALDPDHDGKLLWKVRLGQGSSTGGIQNGISGDNRNVYVPMADWNATPPHAPGGVSAVSAATGSIIWHTSAPAAVCSWGAQHCYQSQPGASTVIPGIVFEGSADGHIRAYATKDGKIVWDFDTAQALDAVNGIKAQGGGIDGSPQIVADRTLYVESGYATMGQGGNALIAFTVDGK